MYSSYIDYEIEYVTCERRNLNSQIMVKRGEIVEQGCRRYGLD